MCVLDLKRQTEIGGCSENTSRNGTWEKRGNEKVMKKLEKMTSDQILKGVA